VTVDSSATRNLAETQTQQLLQLRAASGP